MEEDRLVRMRDALSHRGPDGAGNFLEGAVGLGHRRLAVIDIEGGHQPMISCDGRFVLVFNGEIFNFAALRKELETEGGVFRTRSDTEVLLEAFRLRGPRCVNDLVGQFAFAVWDRRDRRLFLARDRFGQKPLYYATRNGQFFFASEPKAIRAAWDEDPDFDPQALYDTFFFGYTPPPFSLYEGIRQLSPAHIAWVGSDGTVRAERYFRLAYDTKRRIPLDEAAEELHALLSEAVRIRLVSDVPLGILLSGGVDSTMILWLASELGATLRTFCAVTEGVDDPDVAVARRVAKFFGAEHAEVVLPSIDPKEGLESLAALARHLETPYHQGTNSLLHANLCAGMRRFVTVALGGDAGDEIFGGYTAYRTVRRASEVRRRLGLPWKPLRHLPGRLGAFAGEETAALLHRIYRKAYAPLHEGFRPEAIRGVDHSHPARLEAEVIETTRPQSLFDAWTATELLLHNHHGVVWQPDMNGMRVGLEIRAPCLDHRVVQFLAEMPEEYKVDLWGRTKVLQRHMMRGNVPDEVLDRPKTGFGASNIPHLLAMWQEEIEALLFPRGRLNPHLDRWWREEAISALWRRWRSGPPTSPLALRLWMLVLFVFLCQERG